MKRLTGTTSTSISTANTIIAAPLNHLSVPLLQLKAAERPAHSANDLRVTIVSPSAGQAFRPGDTVSITVQITPPVTANDIAVYVAGLTQLQGTNYSGNTYQATLAIPPNYTGALTLTPAITDSTNALITGAPVTVSVVPASPPTQLVIAQHSYRTTIPTNIPDHLYVTGSYPGGQDLDLTSAASGTSYSSNNQQVVTVDGNGNIQYTGQSGVAVVTATNSGISDYADFVVANQSIPSAPQDLTSQVSVQLSGFQLNRATGFYVQTVTVTNSDTVPLSGPLYLIIAGLPIGSVAVTLTNPTGYTQTITPINSPYVSIPLNNGMTLSPAESHTMQLQFLNPSRNRITYAYKVFTASTTP
jgi:hypothetical protein